LGSSEVVALFPLACAAVVVLVGPRLELDRLAQAGLAIGAMVLGVLVPRLAGGPTAGAEGAFLSDRTLLLVMPMVAVATARGLVKNPVYGARVTLAAVLVAFTGAGRAMLGPAYVGLFVGGILLGLYALRVEDRARPPARALGALHVGGLLFLVVAGMSMVASLSAALPPLHDALMARIIARWQASRTGFTDSMALGSLGGMLQSNDVVMRVRGPAPPLVRGVVLVDYTAGQWNAMREMPPREIVETAAAPDDPTQYVEIEHASDPRRYFLPLGARDVIISSRVAQRDVTQVFQPSAGFAAKRVWFARDGEGPPPQAPGPEDLTSPFSLGPTLQATLASWGVHDQPPRERIEMIAERLRSDFTYSLDFDRSTGRDPIIDFLTENRQGHCEYFASAMVLLARAARVPARVVAGYRVQEVSPFGYHIVRERDAHSWAEVWIDDRWQTIDPTPGAPFEDPARAQTPTLSALFDALSTAWEVVDDWLGRRTPFELSLMLIGLFAALILYRTLRAVRAPKRALGGVVDPPLPAFVELARALERRGLRRDPSLTLRRLAERVATAGEVPEPARGPATAAIRSYEALRYGRKGDPGEVERRLREAARAIGPAA
jgi:transglutaminase-like putative cysteine protease